MRRSIDGNCYSFALLRVLDKLRTCVEETCAALRELPEPCGMAETLRGILERHDHKVADLYAYWSSMAPYWDDMDVPGSDTRPLIEL